MSQNLSFNDKEAETPMEKEESAKSFFLKLVQENKNILFGKFKGNESSTSQVKQECWEKIRSDCIKEGCYSSKTWKQLRDSVWSLSKTRATQKRDHWHHTGNYGVPKYTEV